MKERSFSAGSDPAVVKGQFDLRRPCGRLDQLRYFFLQ
jgi:hypothetical protein